MSYIDHAEDTWIQWGDELLDDLLQAYAGKQRKQVSRPTYTANEMVAIADAIQRKLDERHVTESIRVLSPME